MKGKAIVVAMAALLLLLTGARPALAHVPYLEWRDLTFLRPFTVQDVEQSKAIYGWLETGSDLDFYRFTVTDPVRLYVEALVPVCPEYEQFLPSYAVIGPGLPAPAEPLPVPLPDGYGAIVVPNVAPGEPRETFYEPFGAKFYYEGPTFDQVISTPGVWSLLFWDPYNMGGDYVAGIGRAERFSPVDILRSLVNTPIIRDNGELHVPCGIE